MFAITFSKILLILIIGLIVLGPHKLLLILNLIMSWFRTARLLTNNIKNDLEQEVKLKELQDILKDMKEVKYSTFSSELASSIEEFNKIISPIKSLSYQNINLEQNQSDILKTQDHQIINTDKFQSDLINIRDNVNSSLSAVRNPFLHDKR